MEDLVTSAQTEMINNGWLYGSEQQAIIGANVLELLSVFQRQQLDAFTQQCVLRYFEHLAGGGSLERAMQLVQLPLRQSL